MRPPRSRRDDLALLAETLRAETVGGVLLLIAAVAALIWANWPSASDPTSYERFLDLAFGPSALHLHLSIADWAGDGLLAIFFFVAGLEVKREFVAGDLSTPSRAALPVLAAIGGMAVPALVFVLVNLGSGAGALRGWAIPSATDIAFALAVLAVIGRQLPSGLRTFLLTLAVVDDLIAITIIAVFFTDDLSPVPLALALIPLAAFGALAQLGIRRWWLLVPLALVTWALVHASGIHATVAGVLLAFTVPVADGMAERLEHLIRPLSAGVAVPIFAFCAAGVVIGGWSGLGEALSDPIAVGVIAGLVLGKAVGIFGTSWLVARFSRARLDADIGWGELLGLSLLGGIGFTVSLLVGQLAYGEGSTRDDHVTVGVLAGSLLAAGLASLVLGVRSRRHRRLTSQAWPTSPP
ncbi:MAG: Na+/H+ antiporter NhaA type [Frankiales bacterium]|jgi:NhaA family Na+:H+ antiporter|nr:Na+/H+ antiporter NhaA type [Frankiales bacterium]